MFPTVSENFITDADNEMLAAVPTKKEIYNTLKAAKLPSSG